MLLTTTRHWERDDVARPHTVIRIGINLHQGRKQDAVIDDIASKIPTRIRSPIRYAPLTVFSHQPSTERISSLLNKTMATAKPLATNAASCNSLAQITAHEMTTARLSALNHVFGPWHVLDPLKRATARLKPDQPPPQCQAQCRQL